MTMNAIIDGFPFWIYVDTRIQLASATGGLNSEKYLIGRFNAKALSGTVIRLIHRPVDFSLSKKEV